MPCRKCGSCCNSVFIRTRADEDSVKWWRLHRIDFQLTAPPDGYTVRIAAPCYWFDPLTGDCVHYDDRPDICRRFLCESALAE